MILKTEQEAVSFALADRSKDQKNVDLEKSGAQPFSRSEVERLLLLNGYKQYQNFRFYVGPTQKAPGWSEVVLSPITQSSQAEKILEDFVSRAHTESPDTRFLQFHSEIVLPVLEALRTNLLILEVRNRVVFAKAFSGQAFSGKLLREEEVLQRLKKYASGYSAPLKLETTPKGVWRFDKAHVSDPDNPHAYDHLHVYHKLFPFYTTLRVTAF